MVRWWNVTDVTPSGLTLNRTWKLRQILSALVMPAFAWILLESVSRWEKRRLERLHVANTDTTCEKPIPIPEVSFTDVASQYFMTHAPESVSKVAIEYHDMYLWMVQNLTRKPDEREDNLLIETFRNAIAKISESWKHSAIEPIDKRVNKSPDINLELHQQSSIRKRRDERDDTVNAETKGPA
jgi:hypothetical protein